MTKNKGGRPTKLDDIAVKKLEEAFAVGCSIPEACLYADITVQTFYNWKGRNEKLFDRFELLREKPIILARQTVINKMKNDGHLALKYLERKKKDEFSLRSESLIANVSVDDLIGELKKLDADIFQDQEQAGGAGGVQAK